MLRYVLSFTFGVGLVSAATISTSTTCDGVTTVGTDSASCNDERSSANADVGIGGFMQLFDVGVRASIFARDLPPDFALASANFYDDYVLTVFGGTGGGFFYPCFVTSSPSHTGGITGGGSFDGISFGLFETPFASNCFNGPVFSSSKPFTFGVPQIVHVSMNASARVVAPLANFFVAEGDERLTMIAFFNPSGNLLSNVTFTLDPVHEPSALSLMAVGAMFFLVAIRGMRCLHDDNNATNALTPQ